RRRANPAPAPGACQAAQLAGARAPAKLVRAGPVLHRRKAPAAVRAVVQVLLQELLERAAAEPQVLDRPRQVARAGGERKDLAHDLERLAALPVDVDLARLHLADDLAIGAGTQAI